MHSGLRTRRINIRYMVYASVALCFCYKANAQADPTPATFDIAVIRPSSAQIKFERNGETKLAYGTLTMRDVTVSTCIQFAYGTPQPLISGPPSLKATHYDITAKTEPGTSQQQVRQMLRTLLRERFNLAFHLEKKELRVYSLVVAKGGIKMTPSTSGDEMSHENNATGMVARSTSMHELAEYMSDPLDAPLADDTGLAGRYDFKIDFTPYVDMEHTDVRPDPAAVLKAAIKGELGLDMVQRREMVDVIVVDHIDPPSSN